MAVFLSTWFLLAGFPAGAAPDFGGVGAATWHVAIGSDFVSFEGTAPSHVCRSSASGRAWPRALAIETDEEEYESSAESALFNTAIDFRALRPDLRFSLLNSAWTRFGLGTEMQSILRC